jgi:hypothetical protein
MLSLEYCKNLCPELASLSDKDAAKVIDQMYEMVNLAFDAWQDRAVPKSRLGSAHEHEK